MKEFSPEDLTREAVIMLYKESQERLREAESVIAQSDGIHAIEYVRLKKAKEIEEEENRKGK
jgi:flagellin-specific chaperone FliS